MNVYTQYSQASEEKIAAPSYVYLFDENGKTIDKDKSYYSFYRDNSITYTDGSTDVYKYKSPVTSGINTFEKIPSGKYTLFVVYVSYGYVDAASSKNIVVDEAYNMKTEKKVFLYRGSSSSVNYGYQDWNETW